MNLLFNLILSKMVKLSFGLNDFKHFICDYKYHLTGVVVLSISIKFCKNYFAGGRCESKTRLDGKYVIITGANTGIGKATALNLALRGAKVILACRSIEKANAAAKEIREKSGNGNVIVKEVDLSSLASVRAFADTINRELDHVDILINNAGKG